MVKSLNRETRRTATHRLNDAAWEAGFKAAQDESGGAMRLTLITRSATLALLRAADRGDRSAVQLLDIMNTTLTDIDKADRRLRKLCFTCPAELMSAADTAAVGVMLPERPDPSAGMTFGLCERCCAASAAVVDAKIAEALKAYWADLRTVSVTHPEGGSA